jgi:hypothetical protein
MTALVAVPRLFRPGIPDQRVLFVSDMVEDCENKGNPNDKEAAARRIIGAASRRDLPVLNGVQFLAAVPKTQGPVPIEWVRKPWSDVLLSRGAREFQIGVIDQLIPRPSPSNAQARP